MSSDNFFTLIQQLCNFTDAEIKAIQNAPAEQQKKFFYFVKSALETFGIAIEMKAQGATDEETKKAMKAKLSEFDTEYREKVKTIMTSSIFAKILQGNETNKLTKINSRKTKKATTDPFTGSMKITQEDISFTLLNYAKSTGLRQSVYQLLDILLEVYTNSGGHSELITIPLKDYMDRRGLKDEKSARQQIKDDLNTLENIKMTFTQKLRGGKRGSSYFDVGILQHSKGIVNGVITVYLDTVFHTLLGGYNPMPYPMLLWKLSENRNPHSFYFLRKISEMKFMNAGKLNEDTIAVLTLLEASPNMPKYEEIAETDRHYGRRFIEPFERDMDALDEVLTWEYCHSNNIPLTDEELSAMNYEIFHKLYVKIHWRLYPDQTERLQRKAITAKKYAKKKTIQKK